MRAGAEDGSYWPEADYPRINAPARRPERPPAARAARCSTSAAAQRAPEDVAELHEALRREHKDEWLLRWNLLELLTQRDLDAPRRAELVSELWRLEELFERKNPIAMGLHYLGYRAPDTSSRRPPVRVTLTGQAGARRGSFAAARSRPRFRSTR